MQNFANRAPVSGLGLVLQLRQYFTPEWHASPLHATRYSGSLILPAERAASASRHGVAHPDASYGH